MDPLSTCNSILQKIMSDNPDLFHADKTIFDYIHINHGKKIRIYIIDAKIPPQLVAEIAKYYEVIDRHISWLSKN
jgi:phosphoenolpyruvate synthase/pyruvate phosphate dikinase